MLSERDKKLLWVAYGIVILLVIVYLFHLKSRYDLENNAQPSDNLINEKQTKKSPTNNIKSDHNQSSIPQHTDDNLESANSFRRKQINNRQRIKESDLEAEKCYNNQQDTRLSEIEKAIEKEEELKKKSWAELKEPEKTNWLNLKIAQLNNEEKQTEIIAELKRIGIEEITPYLVKQAKKAKFTGNALDYLRYLAKDDEGKNHFFDLLAFGKQDEKVASMWALFDTDDYNYKVAVIEALHSESEDVVETALCVLQTEQMRSDEVVDALLELLPNYKDSKGTLLRTLGAQKSQKSVEPIIKALKKLAKTKHENEKEKIALLRRKTLAIEALGVIGSAKAIESLAPLLKQESNEIVQLHIIESLERIAKQNPEKLKVLKPNTIKELLSILDSDKKNLYPHVTILFSSLTDRNLVLNSDANDEKIKEIANQWREILKEYLK